MKTRKRLSTKYYLVENILNSRLPEHSTKGFFTYKELAVLTGSKTNFCRDIGRIVFAYANRHPNWNCSLIRKTA